MAKRPGKVRWVWRQIWRDVLFLHWRVDPDELRTHLPAELTIDTYEGDAWVSLVLFRLQVAPIGLPPIPGFSSLVEVNLRTYVERNDQTGIYFLSIHADNLAALSLARWFTPLPYGWASIHYRPGTSRSDCEMRRAAAPACGLSVRAEIGAARSASNDDPRQSWLLERYRAFAPARHLPGTLLSAVVDHEPWMVAAADVGLQHNTLGRRFGLELDRPPDAAHFCREMAARFSCFEPCDGPSTTGIGSSFAQCPQTATISGK